jgi:enoyl-CoA hydratase
VSALLVEQRGPVRWLTLNRPDKHNALDRELVEELSAALAAAASDPAARTVVIAGAGRSFCAGYDLDEEGPADPAGTKAALRHDLGRLLEVFDHPRPVIARVHGYCLAGGCDLMMMCDLVVASEEAVFGLPEITFGSAQVAKVLPWLVGARRAKELMLTGEPITASEAHRIGLVNRVVTEESLDDEVERLARKLATVDEVAMRLTRSMINRTWELAGFREALTESVELAGEIETAQVPERVEFERIRRQQGLKAAIRWREERF